MASILVTGCEEDGTDQSANVASGLTFPRPPCAVCLRISRRVCTHHRGKDRLKNRASPASRRSGVTLTRVLLRRDAYGNARLRARAQCAIRDSPRRDPPTTARRGHPCAIHHLPTPATYILYAPMRTTLVLSRKLPAIDAHLFLPASFLSLYE